MGDNDIRKGGNYAHAAVRKGEPLHDCRMMESNHHDTLGRASWCMTMKYRTPVSGDDSATYSKVWISSCQTEADYHLVLQSVYVKLSMCEELLTPFHVVGVAPQEVGDIDSKHIRNRLQVRHRRTTRSPASDYAIANSGL